MYLKFVDDNTQQTVKKIDWDDDDESDDDWALYIPSKGEQIWIPTHGLFEVVVIRWMMEEDDPHVLVKLSFIRRHA